MKERTLVLPAPVTGDFVSRLSALEREVRHVLSGRDEERVTLVWCRAFLSDAANQLPLLRASVLYADVLSRGAFSWVEQPPLDGSKITLILTVTTDSVTVSGTPDRCVVACGADTIRIPKTESADMVKAVEEKVEAAEKEFGRPVGSTLLMAALESARGVMNCYEICKSSDRMIGVALSGGDYTKDLHTTITGTGVELMGARQHMVIAARAAGVQCFDTVWTNLDDMEGFKKDVRTIKRMGFDGKSIINPRQIDIVHEIFTPTRKEIIFAEKVIREIDDKKAKGIGVFTVDGKMIDIAFYDGAKRTIALAKASGVYKGDL